MDEKDVQIEVIRQMAMLLVDAALTVAPLIEATYRNPSPFGDPIVHPTPKEIGASLRARADALRLAFPEGQSILSEESR